MKYLDKKWANLMAHTLHGRLNRKRYLLWALGYGILTLVLYVLAGMALAFVAKSVQMGMGTWRLLLIVLNAVTLLFYSGIMTLLFIGRLHDTDHSAEIAIFLFGASIIIGFLQGVIGTTGWDSLAYFWNLISFLIGVYFIFERGTKGDNRFGHDPLAEKSN